MKQPVTNEALRNIAVDSSFELAHYAIALARYSIRAGKEVHLQDIIKEIQKHPNPNYIHELEEQESFKE